MLDHRYILLRRIRKSRKNAHQYVFVGSGIFKSGDPAKRAAAIVQATANWQDADLLARLSENLGEAMVGINEDEIETIMAARGE